MERKFFHKFEPPKKNPVRKPEVKLTVREIEDAGLREVLQTPGAHLDLRPVFVGIDRDLLRAAVEGDASSLRDALGRPMSFSDEARGDHDRGWIIPLGEEM